MLKSKVDLSLISLLAHIGASLFIRQIILQGYKIPFIYTPVPAQFPNNPSAIQNSDFVGQASYFCSFGCRFSGRVRIPQPS